MLQYLPILILLACPLGRPQEPGAGDVAPPTLDDIATNSPDQSQERIAAPGREVARLRELQRRAEQRDRVPRS